MVPLILEKTIFATDVLQKHRNRRFRFYMIVVSDLECFLASFLGPLGMIFDICSSLIFGCFFGRIFHGARHQNCPKIAPQMDRESQKNRNLCSLVRFGRTRLQFDSIFGPLWSTLDVLGVSWQLFGITFGHVWSLSGIFWSSSKARCQVCSNTLNCPFCD